MLLGRGRNADYTSLPHRSRRALCVTNATSSFLRSWRQGVLEDKDDRRGRAGSI